MRTQWIAVVASLLGITSVMAAPGQGIEATWLVEDGSTKIRFEPCGSDLCGRIVWLKNPNDPDTGKPVLDKYNPEPKLRTRPLLGLIIFTGLKPAKANQWAGSVYNASNGNDYDVTVKLTGSAAVEVEGCGLAGLICQSQKWSRTD